MKTASVTGPLQRIVGRLRACAECEQAPLGPLLTDAANEIERLRSAAEEALVLLKQLDPQHGITTQLAEALRQPPNAALNGRGPTQNEETR